MIDKEGFFRLLIDEGWPEVHDCTLVTGKGYAPHAVRDVPAEKLVNPIACGDCMAAGIARAVCDGREMLDTIKFGIAAAENLRKLPPARLDSRRVEKRALDVRVEGS